MRAVLQRVQSGRVLVDNNVVGQIGHGLVVLLGVGKQDDESDEYFVNYLKEQGARVETGEFQADMLLKINNDGPVTVMLDSKREF